MRSDKDLNSWRSAKFKIINNNSLLNSANFWRWLLQPTWSTKVTWLRHRHISACLLSKRKRESSSLSARQTCLSNTQTSSQALPSWLRRISALIRIILKQPKSKVINQLAWRVKVHDSFHSTVSYHFRKNLRLMMSACSNSTLPTTSSAKATARQEML